MAVPSSPDETRDWVRHRWYAPARDNVPWLRNIVTAGAVLAAGFHVALQAGWGGGSRHSLALLVLIGPLMAGAAPALILAFGMEGELRRLLRIWPRWVAPGLGIVAVYAAVVWWDCQKATADIQRFEYFDNAIWAKTAAGPLRRSSAAERLEYHRAWALSRSTAMLPFYAFTMAVLWKREEREAGSTD